MDFALPKSEIKKLESKLKQLEKRELRSAITKGATAGCKLIRKAARDLAPVGETGELKKNIKTRSYKGKGKFIGKVVSVESEYALPTDEGSKKQEAQKYMEQAAQQQGQAALEECRRVIKESIDGAK